MTYLLDTCAISELVRPKPDPGFLTWIIALRPARQLCFRAPAGGGQKSGVHVVGTKAYVGDHTGADLRIIDVSNPAAPVQVGSVGSGGAGRRHVYVSGSYAFQTIDNSGFRIYDISNSSAPVLKGADTSVGANNVRSVYVSGKYAYLSGDFGLRIYQVFP